MPTIRAASIPAHRAVVRAELLDAFAILLGEKPFSKITMGEVALRTDVGRSTVYRHFLDLEELCVALLKRQTAATIRLIEESGGETSVDALVRAVYIALHDAVAGPTGGLYAALPLLSAENRRRAQLTLAKLEGAIQAVTTTVAGPHGPLSPAEATSVVACVQAFGTVLEGDTDLDFVATLIVAGTRWAGSGSRGGENAD